MPGIALGHCRISIKKKDLSRREQIKTSDLDLPSLLWKTVS
jgi:hypothetical protein